MASIGKTAKEVHADLIAEGHDLTLAEVEQHIDAMVELGFIQAADHSLAEAIEILQRGQANKD